MSSLLANFGFDLNNREIAALFYICIFLVVVIHSTGCDALIDIIQTFFQPKITTIWVSMSLYVATSTWILSRLGLWDWPNLKSTLLWWLTVGFSSLFEAKRLTENPNLIRKLLFETLAISTIIVFIAELVSFPLWIEVVVIPIVTAIAVLITVADNQASKPGFTRVVQFLRILQLITGFTILLSSYWLVAKNVQEFWTLNTLREFGLPILLWIMFIPFIVFLATYMAYERNFIRLGLRPTQHTIANYARWRALIAFGLNTEGVNRLIRDIVARDIDNKEGVKEAIREIKRGFKLERNPPQTPVKVGWQPQTARLFLSECNMVTDDYHRNQWEWFASASLKLKGKNLPDHISYYITGHEQAV